MAGLLSKTYRGLFGTGEGSKGQDAEESWSLRKFIPDVDLAQAWLTTYSKVIQGRRQFLNEVDKVKSFYLVDALVRNIAEDALTPDITSGEIVELSSPISEVDKELKVLQERFDFDQMVGDIILDLLRQGEHTLRNVVKAGEGVTDIVDDVDQTKVVGFYRQGFPSVFLFEHRNELLVKRAYEFAHFVVNKNRLRICVADEFEVMQKGKETPLDPHGRVLPSYVRIGRSVFYGVLSKIKELMLIEMLVPTKKLNDILKGNIVGLQMPASTTAKDGFEAARKYEKFLNKKLGLDRGTQDFSASDVASVAGAIKILPMFGDKGALQSLSDVKEDRSLEALGDRIEDSRKVICTSIGYPYELLFEGNESKGDLLKRYGRYVRQLKAIQSSVSSGLKQISLAHLVNKGFKVNHRDIVVNFRNVLVEVDTLDRIEIFDALISILGNVQRAVDELLDHEQLRKVVDLEKFAGWMHKQMSVFGAESNFIKSPDDIDWSEPEESEEPEEDEI